MNYAVALPNDPIWLKRAIGDLGLTEIDGPRSNPRITEFYRAAHAEKPESLDDSAYAWCSAAMNGWVSEANLRPTYSLMARSWLRWGKALDLSKRLPRGAICVIPRGTGSQGHVFQVLNDDGTTLTTIGGNQSKPGTGGAVTVSRVSKSALLGARWPDTAANSRTILNFIGSTGAEAAGHGAGETAGYLEKAITPEAIENGLSQAQDLAQQAASYLRWAQIALVVIGFLIAAYGIYRYISQRLRPAADPFAIEPSASDDDVPFGPDPSPRRKRKPAHKRTAVRRRKGKRGA